MSDDQLIIRHVKLCDCGRVAGHRGICRHEPVGEDERVDRQWEEAHARRREDRFAQRKPARDSERRRRRLDLSPWELHAQARARLVKLSTVGAAQIGRSSAAAEVERVGPGRQQELEDDPRWRECWRVIRRRLLDVAELLDEAEGLGPVAAATMTTEEKDARILSRGMEGLSALAVYDELGAAIAGSPETVRRKRRLAGLDAQGRPREIAA